jgi:DNA-directed RNA polymerase subunit E'
MYYETTVKAHIRVPPEVFEKDKDSAVLDQIKEDFNNYISKDVGVVIGIKEVTNVGEGVIIQGDGAAYYDTEFKLVVFKPELHEVILGNITEITDFGAFLNMGPIDGMVHISQTMDDFVSFSKSNVLSGKESKKVLKQNDLCRARIIAVSYKDIKDPKIGLTMRQGNMGNVKWFEDEKKEKNKKNG